MELDPKYREENWKIPEGYFEGLEDKVFEKLKHEDTPKRLVFYRHKSFIYGSIAASILILIGSIALLLSSKGEPTNSVSFSDIDSTELLAFTENVELNDDDFEEVLNEETINYIYEEEIQNINSKNQSETSDEKALEDVEEEFSILDGI